MAGTTELRIKLSPDALIQDLGSDLFILDMRRQRYFSLDAVGARVWALLGEYGNVSGTVRRMTVEYEVDGDTARTDVIKLVTRLAAEGLVVVEQ